MFYTTDVITNFVKNPKRLYKIDWIKDLELCLHNPYDSTDLAYYYFHSEQELNDINSWVEENNLGERTYINRWKLRDDLALAVFILKWIK
jgi:hypothetical protein